MCVIHKASAFDEVSQSQDIALAKALFALSPSNQANIWTIHGVDIVLGGHDHLYYISKGVTSWEGYDLTQEVLGAEADKGDVLVVKSGTDFRDLSEFTLELEDTPPDSIRRKVIKGITGQCRRAFHFRELTSVNQADDTALDLVHRVQRNLQSF